MTVCLVILGAILLFWLYRQGLAVSKSIAAVLFVFRPGKNGDHAALDACTGWVQRRARFRESRVYEFCLEDQLSKGEAEAVLLDAQKQELLRLNRLQATGRVQLEKQGRYYLRWEFRKATGRCWLTW